MTSYLRSPLVEAAGLVKDYDGLRAVDGLSFCLYPGEIYGFLGPNGSGKSTTILMMLGLTEPSDGTIQVFGYDPARNPIELKKQIGYLPESVGFYGDLTGRANMRYTGQLNKIPKDVAEARIDALLETVELSEAAERPVSQYSRGMRQRLGLADVLLKEPKIVILDDPTLGLDPNGIQWLLRMIRTLSADGTTVFLASHQLHEVQLICDRVGIMSHGKMVLEGTIDSLTKGDGGSGFLTTLEAIGDGLDVAGTFESLDGVKSVKPSGTALMIESERDVRAELVAAAVGLGAAVTSVTSENQSLQDIYLRYFQTD